MAALEKLSKRPNTIFKLGSFRFVHTHRHIHIWLTVYDISPSHSQLELPLMMLLIFQQALRAFLSLSLCVFFLSSTFHILKFTKSKK